jgi:hypothetical protein
MISLSFQVIIFRLGFQPILILSAVAFTLSFIDCFVHWAHSLFDGVKGLNFLLHLEQFFGNGII